MSYDFETKTMSIVTEVLTDWQARFNQYNCSFGEAELNNIGEDDSYFSEIEVYVWKQNNVLAVFSVVLYLSGKQTMNYEQLRNETDTQLQDIYNRINVNR